MELGDAAERSSAARVVRAALFFEVDPQECGALRQGDIALIHSAPTGEKGYDRHCDPTGRANARPMTGSANQSRNDGESRQCPLWDFFIASSCSRLAVP